MRAEPLPRVFFDTNEGSHQGGYRLFLDQSKSDLAALKDRLRPGQKVVIYMPGELEMAAKLRFEQANDGWGPCWMADPIEGTIKHFY